MHLMKEKGRELWKTRPWLLHYDNFPTHNTLEICKFLAKNNSAVLQQPLYSPNLASCDFFLSLKLKQVIKETYFQDLEAIKTAVTR